MLHARDQVLRLEGLADELVGLHGKSFFCYGAIHHARHQNHRRAIELRVLLDALADFIAVFVRHDHVGDHDIGFALLDVSQSSGGIGISDHVNVLAPEGDLDHLAHGGTIVDKYNRWGG